MYIVIALIAIGLVLYSVGWKPDWQALWTALTTGAGRLFTAPLSDTSVLLKRIAFAAAVVLTLLSEVPLIPAPQHVAARPTVEQSLKDFQSAVGLTPDGVLGPKTLAALQKAYGKKVR